MRPAAGTRRTVVKRAGFGFRQRNQFGHRFHRHRRMQHQHERLRGDQTDGRKILYRIVRHDFFEQLWIDDDGGIGGYQQRVPVGVGAGDDIGADVAVAAGAIVDDEGLFQITSQFGGQRARHQITAAARRKRINNTHRFVRIVLLCLHTAGQRNAGCGEYAVCQCFHFLFPPVLIVTRPPLSHARFLPLALLPSAFFPTIAAGAILRG